MAAMPEIDDTHDPERRSWVASANGHPDFPIQNLPLGVFSPPGDGGGAARRRGDRRHGPRPRRGARRRSPVRRGGARGRGRLGRDAERAVRARRRAAAGAAGAALRTAGRGQRRAREGSSPACTRRRGCTLHLPARIGDYTDFYVGIHHATNVGQLFRPDNPLLPNYKYVPIGYHGRASSVVPSGTPDPPPQRPAQAARRGGADASGLAATSTTSWSSGSGSARGNALGEPIPIAEAAEHIAGYCLLNDWSARDLQAWEYQPLGPFLAKNFGSTVSPWVVTPEALAPFRVAPAAAAGGRPARRCPTCWTRPTKHRARSRSNSRCCC